ncbi:MAG: glycogen synthase [Candidatus Kapaibacterium sp.]
MNILLASAEVAPFAKAGGLADIASALPIEWQKFGQNPIVIMPKYGFIDNHQWDIRPTYLTLVVPMGYWTEYAHLMVGTLPGSEVPVYFVEHDGYFGRAGIYGDPDEYPDNDRRFIFFDRAVFEAARALNFTPDIIHAHDFHTAFTMAFLKSHYRFDPRFSRTGGVYTIHNLAYQGNFNPATAMEYSGFGMSEFYPGSWFEHNSSVNAMKTGVMFADKITTVSPTYSREIRMPYYSEGVQDVLNERSADLIGILNGVYYDEWNPEEDKHLYINFDSQGLDKKRANKHALLKDFGLTDEDDLDLPLMGMVTRLAEQKGIDLLINKFEQYMVDRSFRLILLGSGDRTYEDFFNYMKYKYPKLALVYIGYNNKIAHRIIGSSDFLLMPSRFEPCGLTQMYAMKYGTIPIVRETGGLADTVEEYYPETGEGTGFRFWQYNADDMAWAIRRALEIYNEEPHWDLIRRNAFAQEFSSSKSALEYLKVFKWALEKVRP